MEAKSKLWYLENFSLFDCLSSKEMKMLAQMTTMRKKEKNDFIYFPEDPSHSIFLLKEGRVKIGTYSPDGKEIIKTILKAGEIFGEMGIMGDGKRNDFAQAIDGDVMLCAMGVKEMEDMMRMNPNLSLRITKLIGLRFRKIERKFESLVFKDTRARLVDFIKDMAEENGQKIGDEILIKFKLTHQDIGNLTAIARQTVTTLLNDLEKENQIYLERNAILIRDIKNLK